jgi:acetyltransferase-like isoleucine patch superfamily enzyme
MNKIYKLIKILMIKLKYKGFIKIKNDINFRKGFNIRAANNGYIDIGRKVFFNNNCSIYCYKKVVIGDDTIFGENVKIYDHNHIFNNKNKLIKNQGFKFGEVKIGSNCWIGSNVTILSGVSIGDNVVIGANVLVYKSIPKNKIVKLRQELDIQDY